MLKKLFCKHAYKYYNTRTVIPLFYTHAINSFEFACTKCGKTFSVTEYEIDDEFNNLKSEYNKSIALGGAEIETDEICIKRNINIDRLYRGPAVVLLKEKYLKRGVDLTEISEKPYRCSIKE